MLGRYGAHFEMRLFDIGVGKARIPIEEAIDAPRIAIVDAGMFEPAKAGRKHWLTGA